MTRNPQSGNKAKRVSEVLADSDSTFGNLLRHANRLSDLESLLKSSVDPDLAAQLQVAAVRKNRLILVSPTAAWATRLRMQAPPLIDALRAAGISTIEHIDIRVAPLVVTPRNNRPRRALSSAARQALRHMSLFRGRDR